MMFVAFILCMVALLSTKSVGSANNFFPCNDGGIVRKHNWCDLSEQCTDGSDENYCNTFWQGKPCDPAYFFRCNNSMCIPKEGRCDGYSSCPDQSDEKDCSCIELTENEGLILQHARLNDYRTYQKCMKISVNETQYLDLVIYTLFKDRDCTHGNVTLYSGTSNITPNDDDIKFVLCPGTPLGLRNRSFTFYEDVFIRYTSDYYAQFRNEVKDILEIRFKKKQLTNICNNPKAFKCTDISCILPEKQCDGNKDCSNGLDEENCEVDVLCKNTEVFMCTNVSCVSSEKRCDGKKDCTNGLDEENCDNRTLSSLSMNSNREKASRWVRSQHNADWGWKENTHRAVVALYLGGDTNFSGSNKEDDLIAKQLELEVFTYLLRHKFDKVSPSELAAFINALLVTCHDPRNFYGYDLIAALKRDLKTDSDYESPFVCLSLCNAKEPIPDDAINRLVHILEIRSLNHGFILELQALAVMALTCIENSGNLNHLKQNITEALNNLKQQQMEDGSFGNEYTTALVLQALLANNEEDAGDWNLKSSVQFLSKNQEADGSFGDFLTTYLMLPVLNVKSLVDVGNVNCTDNLKRPRDGDMASDIKSRFGKKNILKYSLYIGDEKDQIHPLVLRAPENITVLELMTLAADIDPKYEFKVHEIKKQKYIYEISNIPNDPENSKFWFIYQSSNNETVPIPEQSPDKIKADENEHIIMWYKTLDSL